MKARVLGVAAGGSLLVTAAAGRTAQSVTNDVLAAVAQSWASDVLPVPDVASSAPSLSSAQGTIALPSVAWTGSSVSNEGGVACTDCSITAELSLTYDVSIANNAVQYLSVVLTSTGQYTLQFGASDMNTTTSVHPHTTHLATLPQGSVKAEFGGRTVDISVSTNVDLVSLTAAVQDDASDFSGRVEAAITCRSGFVYTPQSGLQLLADETSTYSDEQVQSSKSSPGFAAHIALAFSHQVDIADFASLAFKVEAAMQAFSAPGTDVVSGADFFYNQAFLCLFDGDCPYDEVCVSSGECISYQREAGSK
jgi:hypothetical protein